MKDHSQTVQNQFDPQAQAYLTSAVHAAGADLQYAAQCVSQAIPQDTGRILDMGCGAGHLSYALAPYAKRVVAADPSPQMVATVVQAARQKGLRQIETVQASANATPFANGEFCVVASRYSAHHWRNIDACLASMRRCVKTGGYLLMIDVLGHEDPLVDTHLQTIELLRDRSHIRNLTAPQWRDAIANAGFQLLDAQDWPLPISFAQWIERMQTSPQRASAIRTVQQEAPAEVQEALQFTLDGSFMLQTGLFWAQAV